MVLLSYDTENQNQMEDKLFLWSRVIFLYKEYTYFKN